jgi:hypothetical protein
MGNRLRTTRDESGLISVGTAVFLLLAAAAVYILLAVVDSDTDHFGAVPVPGAAGVDLSEGEVQIYYSQGTSPQVPFQQPSNLGYSIRGNAGVPLQPDARGDDPEEKDGVTTQLVGAVSVPEDGIYDVKVTGSAAPGAVKPELTFGQAPGDAIVSRAKDLVDRLTGPLGLLVLAILLVLYAIPQVQRRNRQKRLDSYENH